MHPQPAVDHVLAGWGADSHRAGLERIVAAALEELDLQPRAGGCG